MKPDMLVPLAVFRRLVDAGAEEQLEGLRKGWIQSSEESFYKSFRPESGFWFINLSL